MQNSETDISEYLTEDKREMIGRELVRWYESNKRDLPWRKTDNPYYIWISEVMLQQTQVDTVIPYYEKFISTYPEMEDLAYTPEEEVLRNWEGLGYYSRARNLQKGVREVVEKYGSEIPSTRQDVLKISGIGPYTAGAILSIARHLPEPAVDGNVMRVLSRVFLIDNDITKQKTRKVFESLLYKMIPPQHASSFNQGLMELGALVCRPKNPQCESCPLREACLAFDEGAQSEYPVKKSKPKPKPVHYDVFYIKNRRGDFLMEQRPGTGLLAGMWQLPMAESEDGASVASRFGIEPVSIVKSSETFTHVFTHKKWEMSLFTVTADTLPEAGRFSHQTVEELPVPVPHRKILRYIENNEGDQLSLDV